MRLSLPLGIIAMLIASVTAEAQLFINEIFFDPPGGGDSINEYIELRGTPGASLADHYLVFLEGESSGQGLVDNLFNLGSFSLGPNGFLTLRQSGSQYTSEQINDASANFANSGPGLPPFGTDPGFGNGSASTIGASDSGGEGIIENGSFTAMLIHNQSGVAPVLEEDLDTDDNGLDVPTGKVGWEILDAIAIAEEDETLTSRSYAPITFASNPLGGIPDGFEPSIEPGAEFVVVPYEIEYIGRWGNSTGQSDADWHASNLTDNNGSGFTGPGDFRQAMASPTRPHRSPTSSKRTVVCRTERS